MSDRAAADLVVDDDERAAGIGSGSWGALRRSQW
jgi:hypothetical protein